jgi:hypothetical protein
VAEARLLRRNRKPEHAVNKVQPLRDKLLSVFLFVTAHFIIKL